MQDGRCQQLRGERGEREEAVHLLYLRLTLEPLSQFRILMECVRVTAYNLILFDTICLYFIDF